MAAAWPAQADVLALSRPGAVTRKGCGIPDRRARGLPEVIRPPGCAEGAGDAGGLGRDFGSVATGFRGRAAQFLCPRHRPEHVHETTSPARAHLPEDVRP